MFNAHNIETDDLTAAVIQLWNAGSSLLKGKEKRQEYASIIIQVFDRLSLTSADFKEVIHQVGENSEFESAYNDLYADDTDVEYDEHDNEVDDYN